MIPGGEELAIITLNTAEGIGWHTYSKLVERFGSAQAVIDAPAAEIASTGGVGVRKAAAIKAAAAGGLGEEEQRLASKHGISVITHRSDGFPKALAHIPDPPMVLYVRGELRPQDAVALAFVGSRSATLYGLKATGRLAGQAARVGFTIVSGLARGIDRAAHEAALLAGGRTIGVTGSGLLELYPPDAADIVDRIAASGAVVSEFPLRYPPLKQHFPRRNRIISGVSLGVVVVEAARRSGSLITARHAMEQGREVFAVPGPIDSPNSFGPNHLIRDGAKLVTDLADITSELGVLEDAVSAGGDEPVKDLRSISLNDIERRVFEALDREPVSVDDIIDKTELDAAAVSSTLLILEMKRLVTQLSGKRFAKS
jgi:DNA processing protein